MRELSRESQIEDSFGAKMERSLLTNAVASKAVCSCKLVVTTLLPASLLLIDQAGEIYRNSTATVTVTMGPYPNSNKLFGQTMKKKSSAATRYQRQFGNTHSRSAHQEETEASLAERKAAEAAARRRVRQEQGETIDRNFGYHRLEDQASSSSSSSNPKQDDPAGPVSRRGWLFHMLATTVREYCR